MRVVGVVTELGVEPGLYNRAGAPVEHSLALWDYYKHLGAAAGVAGATAGAGAGAGAGAAVVVAGAAAGLAGVAVPFLGLPVGAYLLYRLLTKDKPLQPLERVKQALLPAPSESSAALPGGAVLLPASGFMGVYADYDSPVFHGLLSSESELKSLMEAEGGHTELLLVDQRRANETYKHAGGGRFSTGLHLPHPKDPMVLVPVAKYSDYLRNELQTEWVQVFEALGAKHILIADATEISAKAKGAVANPAASVSVEMRATYGSSNVEESTYEEGGYDPVRALSNRRWLGDHPAIMGIVEGRINGRQRTWRKTVKVNYSFGVSVEFLGLATGTKGKGSTDIQYQRNYDFFVEFHPK